MSRLLKSAVISIVIMFLPSMSLAADSFQKLPQGHWAYDAIRQLTAKGIIPPGLANKKEATRYEVAEIICRMLEKTSESSADKRDIEQMKKLAAEFKSEIEEIGVRTDSVERRLVKMENGIGSWNLSGTFIFDAVNSREGGWTNTGAQNEWRKEQMYLYIRRRINENTTFHSEFRMGADGAGSENSEAGLGDISEHILTHFYIDTQLKDYALRIGRFGIDFEDEYGLYIDNDAVFGHFRLDGFRLQRQFGKLRATAIIGRNRSTDDDIADKRDLDNFRTHTIVDLKYDLNDKFFAGFTGYWFMGNDAPKGFEEMNGNTAESTGANDWGIQTYSGYLNWSFLQGAEVKGIYYRQFLGKTVAGNYKDNPQSWKIILDLKQDLLKFGSLWLEYNMHDNNFWNTFPDRYAISGSAHCSVGDNMPYNNETSKYFFANFEHSWNVKLKTGIRYADGNYGTSGIANPYEVGAYITWRMASAVRFQLIYDYVNYGQNSMEEIRSGSDSVIMLRTVVDF